MNDTIELFRPTPKLITKKDRLLALLISIALSYSYILLSLVIWVLSSWYMALSTLLLAYIVTGIVSSKLLHWYVPARQHEFSYSAKDIAAWIIDYYHFDEREN